MRPMAVVVGHVDREYGCQLTLTNDQSRHSRRSVPVQRSAQMFAGGTCGGVFSTDIPEATRTQSNQSVNFEFRSPIMYQNAWA